MSFWRRKEHGVFYLSVTAVGVFFWVREFLTVNIRIFNSWPSNLIYFRFFLKVQYRFSIKVIYFFTVCTNSKSSLVSLSVLLDRIPYIISGLLRLYVCLSFWLEVQFVLQSSSSSLSTWFSFTKSNPSLLPSVLVHWARGVYMCITVSPLQQTSLCSYCSWPEHPLGLVVLR